MSLSRENLDVVVSKSTGDLDADSLISVNSGPSVLTLRADFDVVVSFSVEIDVVVSSSASVGNSVVTNSQNRPNTEYIRFLRNVRIPNIFGF